MKEYLLFAGHDYYPCGGWEDFKGSFKSLEDAREATKELKGDWWHIVFQGEVVESKN